MGFSAFDIALGRTQGRLRPRGFPTVAGEHAFVLGSDEPGHVHRLNPGDHAEVAQDVDCTGIDLVRTRLRLRTPAVMPAGRSWEASVLVDGVKQASMVLEAGRTRDRADMAANVSKLGGTHQVAFRLELLGPPGAGATLVELAGLYLDEVAAETATVRPLLANRDPEPGETGVPLGSGITLELVDPGTDGVDWAATRIWVDGILAFEGGASPEIQPGFDGQGAGAQQTADTLRVSLQVTSPLPSDSQVEVRVVSATAGGAGTMDKTYTFLTEDHTPPLLVSAGAIAPREVVLSFSEPVTAPDPTVLVFEPLDAPAAPVEALSAAARGSALIVQLDTELTPKARYRVTAAGVTDLSGNPVQPPYDTAIFKGVGPPAPPGRAFDLWSMLPRHNRREDSTGDLRRFIDCLQEVTDLLLADVDRFTDIFDLERAPELFLDLVLADLGNPFPLDLDELGKRKLAASLVRMYRQKGTAAGMVNAIRFFLGIEAAVDAYHLGTLVLGESELGVDWVLGPSDRRSLYTFDLAVTRALDDRERSVIRRIVDWMKPAHTHPGNLVEPTVPAFIDHWELGLSELAESTILH